MHAGRRMRAFAVEPGQPGSGAVIDVPDPQPGVDECVVAILDVGICGTDREIAAGEYGAAPEGHDRLVLGHECVGRVIRAAGMMEEGDLVVCTVRRPCHEHCAACSAGEPDFCLTGGFTERGIRGIDGFLAERIVDSADNLVKLPHALRNVGVLLEPLSTVEKAMRQAYRIQQRMPWRPERAIITGAGPIGVLAALVARLRGLETLVYSQGEAAGPRAEAFTRTGITYVDAERETLHDAAAHFGAPDLFIEATGFSPLVWQGIEVLATNGAACLLSVTGGDRTAEIPSDRLNMRMVLGNRVAFGSVSAHRGDFEQGVRDLQSAAAQWPGLLETLITERASLDEVAALLEDAADDELKVVIEVGDD